jgi:hypothetical protein
MAALRSSETLHSQPSLGDASHVHVGTHVAQRSPTINISGAVARGELLGLVDKRSAELQVASAE